MPADSNSPVRCCILYSKLSWERRAVNEQPHLLIFFFNNSSCGNIFLLSINKIELFVLSILPKGLKQDQDCFISADPHNYMAINQIRCSLKEHHKYLKHISEQLPGSVSQLIDLKHDLFLLCRITEVISKPHILLSFKKEVLRQLFSQKGALNENGMEASLHTPFNNQ